LQKVLTVSARIRNTHQPLEVNMTNDHAPPDGGNATRPMQEALSAALAREAEGDDGRTAQTLHLVVHKLIARALGGDIPAIKEIFDRMDGKSAARTTDDQGPTQVTLRWKDKTSRSPSTTNPATSSTPSTTVPSASPAS
jgi:mannose/cellobiose epimerase-like protein (N-acyl-D-glucosamine 2-epimerase family)